MKFIRIGSTILFYIVSHTSLHHNNPFTRYEERKNHTSKCCCSDIECMIYYINFFPLPFRYAFSLPLFLSPAPIPLEHQRRQKKLSQSRGRADKMKFNQKPERDLSGFRCRCCCCFSHFPFLNYRRRCLQPQKAIEIAQQACFSPLVYSSLFFCIPHRIRILHGCWAIQQNSAMTLFISYWEEEKNNLCEEQQKKPRANLCRAMCVCVYILFLLF